ncbi:probable glycerol-3-phosphate acyltransferase 8 [Rutidosis leptorrhynchoides]|uniref:probable glycerol-3-phosphate acyltransferase 8 n=1 Tax=Rutidosis leptorrhynchoides TaxID=125765 RepID=UPI003A995F65
MLQPELKQSNIMFPPISECNLSTINHRSIAADLDGTLLRGSFSFPYYVLMAIEAGSLLRGLILSLSIPIITIIFIFISEDLAGKLIIFITFTGIRINDIEFVSRAILPRFYAANVRQDSFEVFDSCERKVIVTANPVVMVDVFVKECLGGVKVIGTEIDVDPVTKRATGFVKEPGFLIGEWKKIAVEKEFGDDLPDIGIGDRESDYDFMSICKESYLVPRDHSASVLSPDRLKKQPIFYDDYLDQPPHPMLTYLWLPFRFVLSLFPAYFNLSIVEGIVKCTYTRRWSWL